MNNYLSNYVRRHFWVRDKHVEYLNAMAAIRHTTPHQVLREAIDEYRKRHELGDDKNDDSDK